MIFWGLCVRRCCWQYVTFCVCSLFLLLFWLFSLSVFLFCWRHCCWWCCFVCLFSQNHHSSGRLPQTKLLVWCDTEKKQTKNSVPSFALTDYINCKKKDHKVWLCIRSVCLCQGRWNWYTTVDQNGNNKHTELNRNRIVNFHKMLRIKGESQSG